MYVCMYVCIYIHIYTYLYLNIEHPEEMYITHISCTK